MLGQPPVDVPTEPSAAQCLVRHAAPTRLLRQIRTNQVDGFGKLPSRNLNSFSTLRVSAWIMRRAPLPSGAIECRELGRAYAPVAALLPGHDMEMKVGRFLSAEDPVVLEGEYSERAIRHDERLCDSPGRNQYGSAFLIGKIEQRRDVPTRDDATLADFELPWIDHGERMFAFLDDLPSFLATCHAQVARISYGKLKHFDVSGQLVFPGPVDFPRAGSGHYHRLARSLPITRIENGLRRPESDAASQRACWKASDISRSASRDRRSLRLL